MEPTPVSTEIQKLRAGKALLRSTRRAASLEDKVQMLLRLQRVYVDIVGSQRPLAAWQRPWNVTITLEDAIRFSENGILDSQDNRRFSLSSSDWVRPRRTWTVRT